MIHIEKDAPLKNDPTLRVAVDTGDYNETDLIECYRAGVSPKTPVAMYQAQYVVFGNAVYHQSEELTEMQIEALLDGESVDKVINNRKMIDGKIPAAKYEGLVVKARNGLVGERVLRDLDGQIEKPKKIKPIEEPEPEPDDDDEPIVVEPVPNNPTGTSTTTPPVINDNDQTSTTTPVIPTEPQDDEPVTTTPDLDFDIVPTKNDDAVIKADPSIKQDSDIQFEATEDTKPSDETVAGEIVAFAKSKIKKNLRRKLGL